MATRKTQNDALARTEAERLLGDEMEAEGLIASDKTEPTEAGRTLLNQIAKTVEYERGVSKNPDREEVPMKRLVITTEWVVDGDALNKK